tara:strand:+ start:6024 stop:6428 length:405 start_codon:yes stop_codon:yes gene_type:complete
MNILKRKKHKHKFSRRRALSCTFVEKSKNNPGYLKYEVTIGEKDGTINTQPVYGKDMQDALSRLINTERTIKIERSLEKSPLLFFIAWFAAMLLPMWLHEGLAYTPWFILYMFVSFTAIFLFAGWWQSYIEKGK